MLRMKGRKCVKQIKVDPRDDDFGAVLNCAVRYAIGRRTYMPSIVVGFILPLVPELTDKTLWCFQQDIMESQYRNALGDDCDAEQWCRLLAATQYELCRRAQCK